MNRAILRLAIPSIISNITVPLLGLVDTTIVGHMGNAQYIAAIAVGSMVFNVIYWLFAFLRMGTGGLTAQAYGRKDIIESRNTLGRSLTISTVIGLLIILLQIPIFAFVLWVIKPETNVLALVHVYLRICVWGAPAMLGLFALNGWFVGMQDTRTPMVVSITQNIVNIVASLCLVYVFHLKIEGVATGTLIAQWAGFLMGLALTKRAYLKALKVIEKDRELTLVSGSIALSLRRRVEENAVTNDSAAPSLRKSVGDKAFENSHVSDSAAPSLRKSVGDEAFENSHVSDTAAPSLRGRAGGEAPWLRFFSVNRDIFFRTVFLVTVNLYFVAAGAKGGDVILAVNTLLMQLFILYSYVMDGFAYAAEALCGRFYGANDMDSLHTAIRGVSLWSLALAVLYTLLYVIGGEGFLGLLTNEPSVVTASAEYLPWAWAIPATGLAAFVLDGIFIGMTFTRGMLVGTCVSAIVFFTVYFTLSPTLHNHALWLAFILYLAFRGIVQYVYWKIKLS